MASRTFYSGLVGLCLVLMSSTAWAQYAFTKVTSPPFTAPNPIFVSTADYDGDGDTDLLFATGANDINWYRNDGGGVWTVGPTPLSLGISPQCFDAANPFSTTEGAVLFVAATSVGMYRWDSANDFLFTDIETLAGGATGGCQFVKGLSDVMAWDVIVFNNTTFAKGFGVYPQTVPGDNTWAAPLSVTATLPAPDGVSAVTADWDSDGYTDLIVAQAGAPMRSYSIDNLVQVGNSTLTTVNAITWDATEIMLVDWLPNTGTPDIYVATGGTDADFYQDTILNSFQTAVTALPARNSRAAVVGDWDQDGDDEVMALTDMSMRVMEYNAVMIQNPDSFGSEAWKDGVTLDYNDDGKPDVVGVDTSGNWVVYRNDALVAMTLCSSDGDCGVGEACNVSGMCAPISTTILPPQPLLDAGQITDVRLADFDGDGDLDAVYSVVSNSPATASVYVLENDGTYTGPTFTPNWNSAGAGIFEDVNGLAVGDCDGDGDQDILAGRVKVGGSTVAFIENVAGVFNLNSEASLPGIGAVSDIEVGDLDNDGDLDVVAVIPSYGMVAYENDGACGFTPKWEDTGSEYSTPGSIAIGEIDGDGRLDIVVSFESTADGEHLHTDFDPTTWTYTTEQVSPSGSNAVDLVLGDFNGGAIDAAPAHFGTIARVFGINPWAPLTTTDTGDYVDGEFADWNGDGRNELLRFDESLGEIQVFSLLSPSPIESYPIPGGVAGKFDVGDLNGDGTVDVLALTYDDSAAAGESASVILNHRRWFKPDSSERSGTGTYGLIEMGDFNNDGFIDLFASKPSFDSVVDNVNGLIEVSTAYNPGGVSVESVVGDFNGDGRLDIFRRSDTPTNSTMLLNSGASFVSALAHPEPTWTGSYGLAAGDFDGDGDLDIVAATDGAGSKLEVFLNNGVGGFSSTADTTHTDASTFVGYDLEAGDYDGDGDVDLFQGAAEGGVAALVLWENDGTGSFAVASNTTIPGSARVNDVELVDFDRPSNKSILAVAHENGGGWAIVNATSITFLDEFEGQEMTAVATGDINNDGKPDMLFGGESAAPLRIYDGREFSTFKLAWTDGGTISSDVIDIELFDVDNDGDLDIMVSEASFITQFNNNVIPSPDPIIQNGWVTSNMPATMSFGHPLQARSYDAPSGRVEATGPLNVPITVFDREHDTVDLVVEYAIRGDDWVSATLLDPSTDYSASAFGEPHTIRWDIETDFGPLPLPRREVQLRARVIQPTTRITRPQTLATHYVESQYFTIGNSPCTPTCGGTEICYFGECREPCTDGGGECLTDECLTENGETDGFCETVGPGGCPIDCGPGRTCYQGTCFPTCVDNGDCTPPSVCYNNRCQADPCDGVGCPDNEVCFGGACFPQACTMDSDCTVLGFDVCLTDGVYNFCQTTDPCSNVTCPAGDTCVEGGCFQNCANNSQCDSSSCVLGVGCTTQDDACNGIACPVGDTCVEGLCFESCGLTTDCSDPLDVCWDATYCAPPDDPCEGVSCAAAHTCYQGSCFPDCVDNGDCTPPDVCFDGRCIDGQDPCEYVACAEGDACYQGTCFPSCTSNAECNPPFSVCFNSTVCQDTFDPCAGIVCPLSQICHEGLCFDSCSAGDPCASPQVCYQDFCNTPGDPCDGVLCPSGETCWEGGCFQLCAEGGACMTDAECGAGEFCQNGLCTVCQGPTACYEDQPSQTAVADRCVVDACYGVACALGDVCYGGGCFDDCTSNADCSDPMDVCWDAMRCAPDACSDVECPVGTDCVDGSCFVGCSQNFDCPGYLGIASQSFTNVSVATNSNVPGNKVAGMAAGDFDGDGDVDLFVNTSSSVNSRLYVSNGSSFVDETSARASHMQSYGRPRSMVLGDYTGDGYLDAARNDTGVITVHTNSGAPGHTFGFTNYVSSSPTSTYSYNTEGMAWIDYDGDSDLDLIAQNETNTVVILRNEPEGTLTQLNASQVGATGLDIGNYNGDFLATGDIEPDGDTDLLLRLPSGQADIFINDGTGVFTRTSGFAESSTSKGGAAFCDFDNDGDLDLYWTSGGVNQIWRQTTPGNFTATAEPATSAGVTISNSVEGVACGDIDHDGDLDLFLSINGDDKLFINNNPAALAFSENNLGINTGGDSNASIMFDYDQSGSLDIYVNNDSGNVLWENSRTDNRYLMIQPTVQTTSGTYRQAVGASIVIRDADGNLLGTRTAGNAGSNGAQESLDAHYGLPYGANVPYRLEVMYPGGATTTKCVIPSTISGYQRIEIRDTDADDTTACATATGWTALIELPNNSGDFCYAGRCTSDPCDGIQCSDGFVCYGGNCNTDCSSGTCPAGETCVSGICVDSGDPGCDGGAFQCPANYICDNGTCLPNCVSDADCGPAEICYQNVCRSTDCGTAGCAAGETCHQGICFEDCGPSSGSPGTCSDANDSCFENDRCAPNGCEALTDTFDANFVYRTTGRRLFAKQGSSYPDLWPQPLVGGDVNSYINVVSGVSTAPATPPSRTARVVLYLDSTRADGNNPNGRYAIWLAHGDDGAACSTLGTSGLCDADSRCAWNTGTSVCDVVDPIPAATYRVRLKNPGSSPQIVLNEVTEGIRVIKPYGSPDEWVITTHVTMNGGTDNGGIVLGWLDASEARDWTVTIEAAFSGGIDRWELYNESGYHTELDPLQPLKIKSLALGTGWYFAPDTGIPCDITDGSQNGICARGTATCDVGRQECIPTVSPWQFEICDGEDNDCDGAVDEINSMRYPIAEYRQRSYEEWTTWVMSDTDRSVASFMNYQHGADDRRGSPDIQALEGTGSIQTVDQQVVAFHHNRETREMNLVMATGKQISGAAADPYGDERIDMRLYFPDSDDDVTEMFVSWYDDRDPAPGWDGGSQQDEVVEWETRTRFDLEWELKATGSGSSAFREADGAAIKSLWSGENAYTREVESRLYWQDWYGDYDDDDATTNWSLYAPSQAKDTLRTWRSLRTRIRPVTASDSVCFTGSTTVAGCELGRYECRPGGVISCSPPADAVCNDCDDFDGDGFFGYDPVTCVTGRDCNDSEFAVNPTVDEVCNGLDDDCDGVDDIKDDAAYLALWGEARPVGSASCPDGGKCGAAECNYAFTCICPDGPEDPADPPAVPCRCGEGLEEPNQSLLDDYSMSDTEPEEGFDEPGGACATGLGSGVSVWALLLVVGFRRRKR